MQQRLREYCLLFLYTLHNPTLHDPTSFLYTLHNPTCHSAEAVVEADFILSRGLEVQAMQAVRAVWLHHQSSTLRARHDKIDIQITAFYHLPKENRFSTAVPPPIGEGKEISAWPS